MSTFPQPSAGIRKFQFDDFDMEDANGGPFVALADEPPPAVFSAEELEAARLEARWRGAA